MEIYSASGSVNSACLLTFNCSYIKLSYSRNISPKIFKKILYVLWLKSTSSWHKREVLKTDILWAESWMGKAVSRLFSQLQLVGWSASRLLYSLLQKECQKFQNKVTRKIRVFCSTRVNVSLWAVPSTRWAAVCGGPSARHQIHRIKNSVTYGTHRQFPLNRFLDF